MPYKPKPKRVFGLQCGVRTYEMALKELKRISNELQQAQAENNVLKTLYSASLTQANPSNEMQRALEFCNELMGKPLITHDCTPEVFHASMLYYLERAKECGMPQSYFMKYFGISTIEVARWRKKHKNKSHNKEYLRKLLGFKRPYEERLVGEQPPRDPKELRSISRPILPPQKYYENAPPRYSLTEPLDDE